MVIRVCSFRLNGDGFSSIRPLKNVQFGTSLSHSRPRGQATIADTNVDITKIGLWNEKMTFTIHPTVVISNPITHIRTVFCGSDTSSTLGTDARTSGYGLSSSGVSSIYSVSSGRVLEVPNMCGTSLLLNSLWIRVGRFFTRIFVRGTSLAPSLAVPASDDGTDLFGSRSRAEDSCKDPVAELNPESIMLIIRNE